MKRAVSSLMILLILTSVLISAFTVRPVRADDVIYIRANGEIDPPAANMTTSDNSTYLFTGDNSPRIQIERDNIVLDGNHYLLNPSDPRCFALSIWANHNVTVRNLEIYADNVGIYVGNSTDVLIETNSARAYYGMYVDNCCSLTIRENTFDASIAIEGMNLSGQNLISKNTVVNTIYAAMELFSVSNVLITKNSLTGPDWAGPEGIVLQGSNITISRNDIDTHGYGMKVLMPSATSDISIMENTISDADNAILIIGPVPLTPFNFTNLRIYHNNFLDNRGQVHIYDGGSCFLDNGYPSGGNYWSDYSGTDVFNGSYQNETGSDGIGDNPYVIEPDMVDHYPLMSFRRLGPVHNINSGLFFDSIQEAINAPTTLDGHTILASAGIYHEDLTVNKSLNLIGEDWASTVIEGSPQIATHQPFAVVEVVTSGTNVTGFTIGNSGAEGSFFTGVYISNRFGSVSNCTISLNNIVGNNVPSAGALYGGPSIVSFGSQNVITQNVIRNSCLCMNLGGNDTVFRNVFIGGYFGCWEGGGNNLICENTFIGNSVIFVPIIGRDTVFHNNFIDYEYPVWGIGGFWDDQNVWDNGYPSGGNYWSDHNNTDLYSGRYQNETGNDGICDNPLVVDPEYNNTDWYPLACPYQWASLLDSSWSEIFQLSLEPVTSALTVSNSEFTLTLRKFTREFVNSGIDVLSLFNPPPIGFVAKAVWNVITSDANGDGKTDANEWRDTLRSILDSVKNELAKASIRNIVDQVRSAGIPELSLDQIAVNAPFAVLIGSGARALSTIAFKAMGTTSSVSMGLGLGILSSGVWGVPNSLTHVSFSFFGGSSQTVSTYSPIELEVTSSSGLILNSTANQIPGSQYMTRDYDGDGELEDKVVLPNNTDTYTFKILPKPGADPMDNYSLTVGADWFDIMIFKDWKVQEITNASMELVAYNDTTIQEIGEAVISQPDVGILDLESDKTVFGQGQNSPMNLTLTNNSNSTQILDALIYANMTIVKTLSKINIPSNSSMLISFVLNYSEVAKGNYTLWAYLPALLGETNTSDNTFIYGLKRVTIPGDINGDFTVDIYDAILLARAHNSVPTRPNWNPNADINGDIIVDIFDAIILAGHFNQHYP